MTKFTKFIGDMGEFVLILSGWTFIGTAVLFLFLLLANVLRAVKISTFHFI